MTRVVAFVPDLMDRSRIASAAPHVEFVASPADLRSATDADVIIVDLGREGVVDAVTGVMARVIGFGPHVDAGRIEAARSAGVEAMPRSKFFGQLDAFLS